MARLRNRIRKSDYFSDGELLRWHRDKRATYSGLYAVAEDSGCLADDPFEWKCMLWPSPLDADITVEVIEQWRDEFIEAKKLVPYTVRGQRYFFLRSFHKHEHPRNPQSPTVPLPPWITWVPHETKPHRGLYHVDEALISSNGSAPKVAAKPAPKKTPAGDETFDEFWTAYPRHEAKRACFLKWGHLTKKERTAAIAVAREVGKAVAGGQRQKEYVPTPLTFINQRRWEDWEDGPPIGYGAPERHDKTTEDRRIFCYVCQEEITADDMEVAVWTEGTGWRHKGCRAAGSP